MDTEATPLLSFRREDDIYLRFSTREKRNILAIVAACGVLPFFVTGTFTPALPQIAEDLESTGEMVNLSVSLSIFAMSVGSLVGATYSTIYGRKTIYLWTLPIFIIGSIGVTFADGLPSLFAWRFFQSMGSSPAGVVGTGVIGDIFKVDERGRAMCVFFAATLIGPSVAPLAGGYAAEYYSWRAMQGALGVLGIICLYFICVFLPETSHLSAEGAKTELKKTKSVGNFLSVNPLGSLWLLRSPIFFMMGIILSICVITIFVQIISLTFTIRERFQIYNEAWVGACFLPIGFGNMAGAIVIGPISDGMVIRWRTKRGGVWYPEDRLRAAILPLLIVIPGSILVLGLAGKYFEGTPGLVITLIFLFFTGMGVDMTFGPCSAYLVDVIQSRSAESLAANTAFRALLLSFSIAITLPLLDSIGLLMTNVICIFLTWASCGLLWLIICRGGQLREWLDVGYSVAPPRDKTVDI